MDETVLEILERAGGRPGPRGCLHPSRVCSWSALGSGPPGNHGLSQVRPSEGQSQPHLITTAFPASCFLDLGFFLEGSAPRGSEPLGGVDSGVWRGFVVIDRVLPQSRLQGLVRWAAQADFLETPVLPITQQTRRAASTYLSCRPRPDITFHLAGW